MWVKVDLPILNVLIYSQYIPICIVICKVSQLRSWKPIQLSQSPWLDIEKKINSHVCRLGIFHFNNSQQSIFWCFSKVWQKCLEAQLQCLQWINKLLGLFQTVLFGLNLCPSGQTWQRGGGVIWGQSFTNTYLTNVKHCRADKLKIVNTTLSLNMHWARSNYNFHKWM